GAGDGDGRDGGVPRSHRHAPLRQSVTGGPRGLSHHHAAPALRSGAPGRRGARRYCAGVGSRLDCKSIDKEGVVSRPVPPRWWTGPVFGVPDIGVGDVALALLLSVLGVTATGGLTGAPSPHQGWAAALAVLLMTGPVLVARRSPLAAA